MERFYAACAIYLAVSILLLCGMQAIGWRERRLFSSRFGAGRTPEELDGAEAEEWQRIHRRSIDRGFWRFIAVAYMFYHLPGFFVSVAISRGRPLKPGTMFIAAAVIWIPVLYMIFRPGVES